MLVASMMQIQEIIMTVDGTKERFSAAAKHNVKQPVVPLSRVMTSSHPS